MAFPLLVSRDFCLCPQDFLQGIDGQNHPIKYPNQVSQHNVANAKVTGKGI